jgi:soluble lytic murein transglycosylase-like protein
MWLILAIGAVAIVAGFYSRPAIARKLQTMSAPLDEIFQKWGNRYGVDPILLKAIATVESSLDPSAENPSDPSVGLMQILCKPDADGKCSNTLNVDGWNDATWERLHDPDFNVMIGAQILAWNLRTYGYPRGIAVYNAWSARNDPPEGPFRNQQYVDRVKAAYVALTT